MKQKTTTGQSASTVCYEMIEAKARERIQELAARSARGRGHAIFRSSQVAAPIRRRRGGLSQRLWQASAHGVEPGTVSVRRPRRRNLGDRFESQVLPLFKRRSQELGAMLPRLYLHGLSSGDFELALRGLLGEGAPLSASS